MLQNAKLACIEQCSYSVVIFVQFGIHLEIANLSIALHLSNSPDYSFYIEWAIIMRKRARTDTN